MRNVLKQTVLLTGLFLAACRNETNEEMQPDPSQTDRCGAAQYQSLVGSKIDPATFANHASVRIVPPGTAVTMDYREDRLNVETDGDGIITRISCG